MDFNCVLVFEGECGADFLWTEGEAFSPDFGEGKFLFEIAVNVFG